MEPAVDPGGAHELAVVPDGLAVAGVTEGVDAPEVRVAVVAVGDGEPHHGDALVVQVLGGPAHGAGVGAHDGEDLVLLHQAAGALEGLVAHLTVVARLEHDLATVDAALGVDVLRPRPHAPGRGRERVAQDTVLGDDRADGDRRGRDADVGRLVRTARARPAVAAGRAAAGGPAVCAPGGAAGRAAVGAGRRGGGGHPVGARGAVGRDRAVTVVGGHLGADALSAVHERLVRQARATCGRRHRGQQQHCCGALPHLWSPPGR